MMARALLSLRGQNACVVAYLPSLRVAVQHFRSFSSYDERQPSEPPLVLDNSFDTTYGEPKCHLGILAPRDKRFPLPGMVGPLRMSGEEDAARIPQAPIPDILTATLPPERHLSTLGQYVATARHLQEEEVYLDDKYETRPTALDSLECVSYECPQLLKKEFADLFPDRNIVDTSLTIITISQKTKNDMSAWNPEVEEEREELLEQFISGAQDMCASLRAGGYWADFIDPSSGKPYLGVYTNASLFETDERYRNLGFEIEDLGCCRVITHHVWGKHAYIGTLFTDAPPNHPVITDMTKDDSY